MKQLSDFQSATPESVWAILQRTAQMQEKMQEELAQERKEKENAAKKVLETWNQMMDKSAQEAEKRRQEADKRSQKAEQEAEKRRQEAEQEAEKRRQEAEQEAEKRSQEAEKRSQEAEKRMKKIEETMGSWANNHGEFAEEYFFNSFENGQQDFFGEKFDEIEKNVKGIKKNYKDEYDILLINGKSVGIVEVKFKAHKNDVPKILKKAQTIRINFPEFKNHRVYLGLATLAFYPELEQECIDHGIAIIKQVGDNVVINDKNLKVY